MATQAPTSNTMTDFWMMVWQEQVRLNNEVQWTIPHYQHFFLTDNNLLLILFQVETLVCLLPDVKEVYWPTERREPLKILKILEVTLQSTKNETFWTEKIFTLLNKETNTSRVVIHLQLNPNVRFSIISRKEIRVAKRGHPNRRHRFREKGFEDFRGPFK